MNNCAEFNWIDQQTIVMSFVFPFTLLVSNSTCRSISCLGACGYGMAAACTPDSEINAK